MTLAPWKKNYDNLDSILKSKEGEVLRRQRNRMGRPISPSKIHQRNISMLSKFHKTTSEFGRGYQAPREADHCLQKQVGKNIKDKKRDKGGREGAPSQEGNPIPGREAHPRKGILRREVSKHQETLSLPSLWRALEAQRAT